MRGKGTQEFVGICKRYGWTFRRYGDSKYCPHCRGLLPKTEKVVDYGLNVIDTWVEVKADDSSGRWNWAADIGPKGGRKLQRQWLDEHGGWLLIFLGQGRVPNGRGAWLVPWPQWKQLEKYLLQEGIKSLSYDGSGEPHHKNYRFPAGYYLGDTQLHWDKGWIIPTGHPFWIALHGELHRTLRDIEKRTGRE